MAEPQCDDRRIDSGRKQLHGTRVAQDVGCHGLGAEGRAVLRRCTSVLGNEQSDRVAAEGAVAAARKERSVWISLMFSEPGAQDATRLAGEWRDPFLAAFAVATQMGARVEVYVQKRSAYFLCSYPAVDDHVKT